MSLFEEIFGPSPFSTPGNPPAPRVTLDKLIERKRSLVTVRGKLYRITVEEIDPATISAKKVSE